MRASSVNTGAYNCIAEAARRGAATKAMNSVYYTVPPFLHLCSLYQNRLFCQRIMQRGEK